MSGLQGNYSKEHFQVVAFRKEEKQAEEEILQSFVDFLKDDYDYRQFLDEEVNKIVSDLLLPAITAYLGYEIEKVESGEKEMLKKWVGESC